MRQANVYDAGRGGGRLYATVIANEAWDAALAKGEDKPKTAKGAKQSYKKKGSVRPELTYR